MQNGYYGGPVHGAKKCSFTSILLTKWVYILLAISTFVLIFATLGAGIGAICEGVNGDLGFEENAFNAVHKDAAGLELTELEQYTLDGIRKAELDAGAEGEYIADILEANELADVSDKLGKLDYGTLKGNYTYGLDFTTSCRLAVTGNAAKWGIIVGAGLGALAGVFYACMDYKDISTACEAEQQKGENPDGFNRGASRGYIVSAWIYFVCFFASAILCGLTFGGFIPPAIGVGILAGTGAVAIITAIVVGCCSTGACCLRRRMVEDIPVIPLCFVGLAFFVFASVMYYYIKRASPSPTPTQVNELEEIVILPISLS